MQEKLTRQEKGNVQEMDTTLIEDSATLSIIANPVRRQILTILTEKALYPAELAKTLKMHEQKVYYHVKQLINGGFLEETEREEIRGTVAKRFKTRSCAYSYVLKEEWKSRPEGKKTAPEELTWFFEPFLDQGQFNGHIIVGSPDPHGTYKAYARDGHYTIDLSLLMGNIANLPKDFTVCLDVDTKKEQKHKGNMILLGGPLTNTLVEELNEHLDVQFMDKPWSLRSKQTGKIYAEDTQGVIQLLRSPFNPDAWILHIAGVRAIGTKAAILAITRDRSAIRRAFMAKKRPFSVIVQGFDVDGDGSIESIEIME